MERIRIEVHADITRRLARGEGPGTVPIGLLNSDISSWAMPQGLLLTGELDPGSLSKKKPLGRLGRGMAPKAWNLESLRATSPDWVYPGAAGGGVFRDAVDMVRLRGGVLVEELLAR